MHSLLKTRLTAEEVESLLTDFDKMFSPALSSNVDIVSFSQKLAKYAFFILCKEKDEIAGYIAYYENEDTGVDYITSICVRDKYRSNGIATKMIDFLISNTLENIDSISLVVRRNNATALRFYTKTGFVVKEEKEYTLLMEKQIKNMTEQEIKYNAFVVSDEENNQGRLVNGCDELRFLLKNPEANTIFAKHYRNEILTYATRFSPFYRQYENFKTIQDFPIVTKQFLKDHWDEMVIPEYGSVENIKTKFTSGSTGTPFKMILDKYKYARWVAANKIFREMVGVKSHEKTLFVSDNILNKNTPRERMERDNVYYVRVPHVDNTVLKEFVENLMNEHFKTMTALASFYDMLAKWIQEGNAPAFSGELIAVFSVSETLKETTRKIISDYFHCPMYVYYANEENGVLGVEDGTGKGCRANNVDFYIEVLKMDSDEPAVDGEVGRLVITDYFNKAFPIIRYENGDLISVKHLPDGSMYIMEILGRMADTLYTTDGKMVHYFEGISFMEQYMDIKQFQLIQEDYHHFKWILNTENHSYEESIIDFSKNLFGQDSEWVIEYVTEIPKLRSGKHRMTVCNIKR